MTLQQIEASEEQVWLAIYSLGVIDRDDWQYLVERAVQHAYEAEHLVARHIWASVSRLGRVWS
ncbi:hypothetical protein ACFY2T_20260 [Streptomyces sp. NPDC001260]|uniref:hypothetical protein n=1 Tax=Streptomyces sp. NPDC001260 TaxID=3364551 RepID=UPI00369A531A